MKDDARPERGGPTEDEDLRDDDFDDGEDEVELSDAQIASYEAARDAFVARLSAALAPPGRAPVGRITFVDDEVIEVTPYFEGRQLWHRPEALIGMEPMGSDLDFVLHDGDGVQSGWAATDEAVIREAVALVREAVDADSDDRDDEDEDE